MTGCSVTKCTNRADSGKSLYRIPTARHDVRRRPVWLLRMGRRSPTPKNARICENMATFVASSSRFADALLLRLHLRKAYERRRRQHGDARNFKRVVGDVLLQQDHFESKEFETCQVNGRRKLKPNAVPSLFLNLECHPATEEQSANIASQVDVRSAIVSESVKPEPAADIASQVDVHSAILLESVKHEPAADIASQVDVHSAILLESVKHEPAADIASQVDVHSAILLESVKHEPDNVAESYDAPQAEKAAESSDGHCSLFVYSAKEPHMCSSAMFIAGFAYRAATTDHLAGAN